ncbi:MAG TPA: glutathione S-transferase family protein [Candidatus Binataceae bacterium]|nr:glutathione S-transferase family protein [Candidatus Binataceae bacterium]
MLKLHGTSKSRAARSLWAIEEIGVKYEHVPTAVPMAKSSEHMKLNPNGHIPVLEDDGHVVWESMAINLYLAEKYGKAPLWPSTAEGHADAIKWSFFAMTEIEPSLMTILVNKLFMPPDKCDNKAVETATTALKAPLKVLDDQLKGREYLLGNDFTIADLNVAAVLSFATLVKLDMSSTPAAQAWLQKCLGREANQRVRKLA